MRRKDLWTLVLVLLILAACIPFDTQRFHIKDEIPELGSPIPKEGILLTPLPESTPYEQESACEIEVRMLKVELQETRDLFSGITCSIDD